MAEQPEGEAAKTTLISLFGMDDVASPSSGNEAKGAPDLLESPTARSMGCSPGAVIRNTSWPPRESSSLEHMLNDKTLLSLATLCCGALSITFAIVSRWATSQRRMPPRTAVHLQDSLLPADELGATPSSTVLLAPTKLIPSALAALSYVLCLIEGLKLWLDCVAWQPISNALAFLAIGIATEVEANSAPNATASTPWASLWRLRALLRFASVSALALTNFGSIVSGSANWLTFVQGGCAALLAAGIMLTMLMGPPRPVPVLAPPPPMHRAWLVPKLLYAFWIPIMLRAPPPLNLSAPRTCTNVLTVLLVLSTGLLRRVRAKPDDPIRVSELPHIDASIAAASAWAAGASMRAQREAKQGAIQPAGGPRSAPPTASLIPEMWQVIRLDATLQFLWCFVVLFVEYAAPLGPSIGLEHVHHVARWGQ